MTEIKITSDKIEEIFLFMNFFKPNELFRYEYKILKHSAFPHCLYVTLGTITERKFISCLKKFNKLYENLLIAEVLEYKPEFIGNELRDFKDLSDIEIETIYVIAK